MLTMPLLMEKNRPPEAVTDKLPTDMAYTDRVTLPDTTTPPTERVRNCGMLRVELPTSWREAADIVNWAVEGRELPVTGSVPVIHEESEFRTHTPVTANPDCDAKAKADH